jgi:ribosomal subunit interface protein
MNICELEGKPIQIPLQVTFRDMPPSDAIESHIIEKAGGLERFCDKITSCRVIVEAPHRRHHKGKLYHVRVDITVPGGELVVKREPRERAAHEDIYVAIRDAFDAARRELQDYARRRRGQVKVRETPPTARIVKLFPDEGYGFLETPDGRELYFHRNSVLEPGFERISVGTEVRFAEEEGEKGPQASTVKIAGGEGRIKNAMPAKAGTEEKT